MLVLSKPSDGIRGLRWRLEYSDKPTKQGPWNYTGDDVSLQAWSQSKENLLFAAIEAKDHNQVVHRVFECSGQDFFNFQWEAEQRFSMNGKAIQHRLVGLTLVSRIERATIYINGSCEVHPRQADDLDTHYLYGKV